MKIMWIEDFGSGLNGHDFARQLFKNILPEDCIHEDEEIENQLPELISKNSIHELYMARSFKEFNRIYKDQEGDFDAFIIDINLERHKTLKKDKPKSQLNNLEFDKKAGLFIYNQIKRKYPDSHIAFFTAENITLKEFKEDCGKAMIETPKNSFIKSDDNFVTFRKWLSKRINNKYMILRRGIIEGCKTTLLNLAEISNQELENKFLFHKTTTTNISENIETYRYEIIDYLEYIMEFYSISERSKKFHNHSLFLRDLSKKWDRSLGDFNRNKVLPKTDSEIEFNFHEINQMVMKVLRNFSAHDMLNRNLAERDIAYFFMLSMRAIVQVDVNQIFPYERQLASLFEKEESDINSDLFKNTLENKLFESYNSLKREIPNKAIYNNNIRNQFMVLFDAFVKSVDLYEENGEIAEVIKLKTQEKSLSLFYHAFWHGIHPLHFEESHHFKSLISFDFSEKLDSKSIMYFLAQTIFKTSFTK